MSQLVPSKDKVMTVRNLLEKCKSQIAMALPKHMTPDRMMRVAMTEIQKTPALLDCSPVSLVAAVIQASQLGLEIGVLGQAYLVPFKGSVTLIPGYRGLVQLARRSGEIVSIEARIVHAKDLFTVAYGLNPDLTHKPWMPTPDEKVTKEGPGPVLCAYACARFKDGGYQFEVMSLRELDAIKTRSKASSGPWVTDTEEMYRKTVTRRLCKWLPASIELARALELDNNAEEGLPQDLSSVIDIQPEAEETEKAPAGRLGAATEALAARANGAAVQDREAGMEG
jgi:recombination protein RecT